MKIRRRFARTAPLAAFLAATGLAHLQAQSPSPAPSPMPSASARAEEIPEAYRRVLATLKSRAEEPPPANELLFGRKVVAVQPMAKPRPVAPTLAVRAIKQVEGEWAAFLEGERRPVYPGDVVRGSRVVRIEADGVTFQFGTEQKKVGPKIEKKPFPELAFTGIIDTPGGRVVLLKGRPDPLKVGDVVDGAKILEITPAGVNVEYDGAKRMFAPK